ncbi:HlyD family secretion protein [Legionella israelensis]|uniref:HlyD family secretion protein n=1 Tax=Legionella israelensis TaxID=454 RepID=A0AAX1EHK7_9GAMM|nr:HlyD family secretion protein [Legionella israelensis]QBR84571.1 HlyD family secretion protein [Legionella israelensis]
MNLSVFTRFKYWPQVSVLALLLIGYSLYRYFAFYDTRSSDAYVSAHVINMAPLVSGPVTGIFIRENQAVRKGEKLIEIDPLPYLYAVRKAESALNIARLNYENDKMALIMAQQKLKQAKLILALSQDHFARYSKLEIKGDMAKITLIDLTEKIKQQEAAVEEAVQELKIAEINVDDNPILKARAELDEARYLYEHTTIKAPATGYVTNFNLRIGQYVKTGEGLFALIDTNAWWIVTRYRETALRLIKPGDKARIMIDMYPGKVFHGHVESIGWGINRVQSGNVAKSTLSYLEPTEDWIRIAQRFPVRIFIDDLTEKYPLRIGASATTVTYR